MAIAREEKILEILQKNGTVSVNELIDILQVSPATVRRDLERLEQKNKLRRTYGGAIDIQSVGYEPSYSMRIGDCTVEKKAIAKAVTQLIQPREIVALDAGTTTTEVAKLLVNIQPLTVVTPSLTIGQMFGEADREEITVILSGGILRSKTLSLVGDLCEEVLLKYRCDKAIIGCNALSPELGAMNTNLLALGVKKSLVSISKKLIVVADHTKIGRTALATSASIEQIDTLVTDWQTPAHLVEEFVNKGIHVIVAQP
ncbi:DeoR/GlpR transcriptional regulator [Paenibacillus naphthalenovorans]|uniref:DeoR/GlpR family DNA-binding transcription regulator n=1 Tax=Paenibacillus naphthalenovorans TaxID=162209 RepID=UPI0010B9B901|nr:DeoR/GlpR family DNA-binding transcription regulator [Paenibacillus naphthalenovorans]GCL71745.1 DeoR/GlpR transcriptional regulator [Paenibacillus naphthalenovorans]